MTLSVINWNRVGYNAHFLVAGDPIVVEDLDSGTNFLFLNSILQKIAVKAIKLWMDRLGHFIDGKMYF